MTTDDRPARGPSLRQDRPGGLLLLLSLLLRLLAVVGLAVNAWIHLDLAPERGVIGDTLTQEHLFYAQGIAAALVGLWLLLRGDRLAWAAAFMVSAGGLGLLLLYHYVNVGEIGPVPNMYDPLWYDDKRWTAIAETVTAGAALVWFAVHLRRRG